MSAKPRREDRLIELFLSAYEDGSWADAALEWLDRTQPGTVEVRATRRSDGVKLAIEHTLIEFFGGERTDFERFKPFLSLEDDSGLAVPGKIIYINVPRGILDGMNGAEASHVVAGVQAWLQSNLRSCPTGWSQPTVPIVAAGPLPALDVVLQVRMLDENRSKGHPIIRRYGQVDVAQTVKTAMTRKLPKLVATAADRWFLFLERNQWMLDEVEIHRQVEEQRESFPALPMVNVWTVETVGANSDLSGYVAFSRYSGELLVEDIAFYEGKFQHGSKNGMPI